MLANLLRLKRESNNRHVLIVMNNKDEKRGPRVPFSASGNVKSTHVYKRQVQRVPEWIPDGRMHSGVGNSGGILMEKKTQNNQEKNLSELMEFDFDDILMDEVPGERKGEKSKAAQPKEGKYAASKTQEPIVTEEQRQKQLRRVKKKRRKRGFKIGLDIVTWIKDLAVAVVVFWFLTTFIASSYTMPDGSMDPTVAEGEHLIISKIVYRFTQPDRGDVVAFEYTDENGQTQEAISRVVGLPGDTIVIDTENHIKVNDILLRTDYCDGEAKFVAGEVTYPYTLPDGFYFLLSDSDSAVSDSRFLEIGAVAEEDIFGRVIFCYWPKDAWRPIG